MSSLSAPLLFHHLANICVLLKRKALKKLYRIICNDSDTGKVFNSEGEVVSYIPSKDIHNALIFFYLNHALNPPFLQQ